MSGSRLEGDAYNMLSGLACKGNIKTYLENEIGTVFV
jgi:hypothetical protein